MSRAVALAIPGALALLVAVAGLTAPTDAEPANPRGLLSATADAPARAAPTGIPLPAPAPAPAEPRTDRAERPERPEPGPPADLAGDATAGARERPAAPAGELDEKTLKKIAKLEKKIVAKQKKIAAKQAKKTEYLMELAAAQAELAVAEAMAEGTEAELKAKLKAVKKASAKVAKWQKKITKAQAKIVEWILAIQALLDAIEQLDPGYDGPPDAEGGNEDEGDTTPAGGPVSVPLIIQEVLTPGTAGAARPGSVATFGLPFAEGDQVGLVNGRPALAVLGSDDWQFRTLATWPDGSVKWALVDLAADVPAGAWNTALTVVNGEGRSGPDDLAYEDASMILVNTGTLVAQISKDDFNLFHRVWVNGVEVVPAGESFGILGMGVDGSLIVPKPGTTTVAIEENGPARAVIRADGTLHTLQGFELLDYTCRIVARVGSADLQVDFTVRNANIARPQHVVIDSLGLVVRVDPGANPVATVARHNGVHTTPLAGSDWIYLHQAQSDAYTYNTVDVMEGQEGYEIVHNGAEVMSLGNSALYPKHGYADLSGESGGMTAAYRLMPYQSPASLELFGSGDVMAGLFSSRHAAGKYWSFSWRQHESRTVLFSFHVAGQGADAAAVARGLDLPVSGRAADYLHYDRAGVLPYRLVTVAEEHAAFQAMDIDYTLATHNETLMVTRWLYAHEGGGNNNHDSIERRLGGEWLRQGFGGQFLTGLDLALYKSEWQILRSDNFHDEDDPGAVNGELPHETGYEADYEHRYRDGMILAYFLTGDPRLRDALFDEAEILADLINYPQDRGMYMSIRALAVVHEFTQDAELLAELKERLQYFCTKTLNVNAVSSGWGWQAAPDAGSRRYYASNVGEYDAKPAGDPYLLRGFFNASLGPIAMYHAARVLGLTDVHGALARGRMRDLAWFTRHELYPWQADPADRWLVYSYGLCTQTVYVWENSDFHPMMLGMAESFLDTDDEGYMDKAVEQMQAFAAHDNTGSFPNNLHTIETRLDVQHFLRAYLDWIASGGN